MPNKSLIITLLFAVVSFFSTGVIHVGSVILAATAGTIWSYQEALDGTNKFRRMLGLFGFVILALYLYLNFQQR